MESKHVVQIKSVRERLRKGFRAGANSSYSDRIRNLTALENVIHQFTQRMQEAVQADLGRSGFMTDLTETTGILDNIAYYKAHLTRLMARIDKEYPALLAPGKAYLIPEPYGVALVIGSWNFPFETTLDPLVCAIAAGNTAIIKPSEMTANSSAVMKEMMDALDSNVFGCFEGGPEVAIALLEQQWDLIVFTGSPDKGKLIAAAAAKHLTPVVLELGGKNPVIVDKDVNMDNAAKRIIQGRYINAGQLCISPDLALVHVSRLDEFLDACKRTITEFFGPDPKQSSDYSRIVNDMHTRRISSLLEGHGGTVIVGGQVDFKEKYIAPTIVLNPDKKSPLGSQEVFGPILVVYTFNHIDECIELINDREKPLALYYFGSSQSNFELFKAKTSSGNVTWNDCVFHHAVCDLPFGGVGNSGTSCIFGEEGFRAMSHNKSIVEKWTLNAGPLATRYPPYTEAKQKKFMGMKSMVTFSVEKATKTLKRIAIAGALVYLYYGGHLNPIVQAANQYKEMLVSAWFNRG